MQIEKPGSACASTALQAVTAMAMVAVEEIVATSMLFKPPHNILSFLPPVCSRASKEAGRSSCTGFGFCITCLYDHEYFYLFIEIASTSTSTFNCFQFQLLCHISHLTTTHGYPISPPRTSATACTGLSATNIATCTCITPPAATSVSISSVPR